MSATLAGDMPAAWRAAVEQRLRPGADWRDRLILNASGVPRPVEANVVLVLRLDPAFKGSIRFNELTQAVECSALPWRACEGWRAWTDADDTALAVWCQNDGLMAKPATCAAAVQLVAMERPHHPVREYLSGLKWDGKRRLDTWLVTYLGAKAEPGREEYLRQVSRKTAIQPVARALKPGCKADHMPVVEGWQGLGKSSAIRALVPDESWFTDEIGDPGSKEAAENLRGKWIVELPELAAISARRVEAERTKAFITRQSDHYRPPYGRRSQDFARQCVFFGTTNADSYLQDETGGRRFWSFRAGKIDLEALRRDRDQLWAEAVVAYQDGETWWLDAEAELVAREEQAARRHVDVWEEPVLDWADRQTAPFTAGEALKEAIGLPIERQGKREQMRVAAILKANGWTIQRDGKEGRKRGYVRESDPSDDPDGGGSGGGRRPDPRKPEADEVGTGGGGVDEVGTAAGSPKAEAEASEVGTDARGVDEVGTEKPERSQRSSTPSTPSTPFSRIQGVGKNGRIISAYLNHCSFLEGFRNRCAGVDGVDGVDGPRPAADPNACVHCGKRCDPSDQGRVEANSGWAHFDCDLEAARSEKRLVSGGSQAPRLFIPTKEWQEVSDGVVLPPGLQVRVNVASGRKEARRLPT